VPSGDWGGFVNVVLLSVEEGEIFRRRIPTNDVVGLPHAK